MPISKKSKETKCTVYRDRDINMGSHVWDYLPPGRDVIVA